MTLNFTLAEKIADLAAELDMEKIKWPGQS